MSFGLRFLAMIGFGLVFIAALISELGFLGGGWFRINISCGRFISPLNVLVFFLHYDFLPMIISGLGFLSGH
jgi:phosphate starvation-inducible membrane PsiE